MTHLEPFDPGDAGDPAVIATLRMVSNGEGGPVGSLSPREGEPIAFHGWLELAGAVEALTPEPEER